ncbi:MAG TPA: hypothetical protein VMI11_12205 [Actinomycetes bacterium]|nr:hypothetical protein [Actinomycetes bacterium]
MRSRRALLTGSLAAVAAAGLLLAPTPRAGRSVARPIAPPRVSQPPASQPQHAVGFTLGGPRAWTEAQVGAAVAAHVRARALAATPLGGPRLVMTDTPAPGGYLTGARVEGGALVVRAGETTRLLGWEEVGLVTRRELTLRPDAAGRPVVVRDAALGPADLADLAPPPARLRALADGPALGVGDASRGTLAALAAAGARAVPRVSGFWGGDWSRRVVIVGAATLGEFAAQIGDAPALAAGFAAVTTGQGPPGLPPGAFVGSRVYPNPGVWARLDALGRRVVVTHETTHVAAQAAARPGPPTWLSEGVADEVGFAGTGVPERVLAQAGLAAAARTGPPARLPSAAAFSGADPRVGAVAYADADVAVRLLVRTYGTAGLRRFFRDVTAEVRSGTAPGVATARVMRRDLGTSLAAFTAAWRAELRRLAH